MTEQTEANVTYNIINNFCNHDRESEVEDFEDGPKEEHRRFDGPPIVRLKTVDEFNASPTMERYVIQCRRYVIDQMVYLVGDHKLEGYTGVCNHCGKRD